MKSKENLLIIMLINFGTFTNLVPFVASTFYLGVIKGNSEKNGEPFYYNLHRNIDWNLLIFLVLNIFEVLFEDYHYRSFQILKLVMENIRKENLIKFIFDSKIDIQEIFRSRTFISTFQTFDVVNCCSFI